MLTKKDKIEKRLLDRLYGSFDDWELTGRESGRRIGRICNFNLIFPGCQAWLFNFFDFAMELFDRGDVKFPGFFFFVLH